MMRNAVAVLLFFLPVLAYGKKQGQERIDSLVQVLPGIKEDTNKVKILNDLSISLSSINPQQGISYGEQALALATKLEWKTGIARAYSVLGTNYTAKSEYKTALEYDLKALNINEETGNKNGIAAVTNNIGLFYQNQSDYPNALAYYFKALKINEEIGNKNYKAANLSNIGEVYTAQGKYAEALDYSTRSLKLFEEQDNQNAVANQLINIGIICAARKEYPKAMDNYARALKINEENGHKAGIAECEANIGSLYLEQKMYADAYEHFLKAMDICRELGNTKGTGTTTGKLGELYLSIAKDTVPAATVPGGKNKAAALEHAIEYLEKGVNICKEVGAIEDMSRYSMDLSEAYTIAGKEKEAYESYKVYIESRDSVFSLTNSVKIMNMETERQIGLKNKQIEINRLDLQKKKNERVFYIAGISLLLVVIFVVRSFLWQRNINKLLTNEKKRSDDLLLNILPGEVADELKRNGRADVKHFDHVTVMFTAFVNFTQVSERLQPQELIDELHACFKAFDEIVTRYNIEKIKTVGDAYLAAAGVPVPDARHAENMIRVAMEINKFMHERKKRLGDKTFEVRIGVHSGSVVAGIVGVKKFAYDIWGDTVNTASRMEAHSEAGKINVSQTTYEMIKYVFPCTYRGEIDVKNKGAVGMYFIDQVL